VKFEGIMTALVTPMNYKKIDLKSLGKLLDFQLKNGVQGFVVNGTTAESPTLSRDEVSQIFNFVKKEVPKNFPLIVGTGSNSTAATVEFSKVAESWGADALLVVVPYYNKPPQRGLQLHFTEVAKATKLPNILYNVPGRTITALELDTIEVLSRIPNIVGIKEASGNIQFAKEIRKACGPEFTMLSGDDETFEAFQREGGNGVISVSSHVIPSQMRKNETEKYLDLVKALFLEANPIPVKMALWQMGIIDSPELRAPLVEMDPLLAQKLMATLIKSGVLNA
jgi:4-hydroxy-tetrahydrodipicolinate synthase